MRTLALATLALALASPALAQQAEEPVTPASVVAASQDWEWVSIPPEDLLLMDLAPDADGNSRRVVIQLIPAPFSQPWVENIRALARVHWWDGTSVYRVVDNWVTQWGDVSEEKALPEGVVVLPAGNYGVTLGEISGRPMLSSRVAYDPEQARAFVETAPQRHLDDVGLISVEPTRTERFPEGWHERDAYAPWVQFHEGWPVGGADGLTEETPYWPLHCPGYVGVARNVTDGGSGSELYAVTGHAPRQLDRNIAVVGRVIEGIEHLSALPRGTGGAGVYATREEDTPIATVRLASEIADPPEFEFLYDRSISFQRYIAVRANRQDEFYTVPAGGVDVCNVQVPIRPIEAAAE